MIGRGQWNNQNKVLPGIYVNVSSGGSVSRNSSIEQNNNGNDKRGQNK